MLSRNWVKILGVRVDGVTWDGLDNYFRKALLENNPKQLVTVNGEHILAAARSLSHKRVINEADLVVPDATNVIWVSALLGKKLPQKTPGVDVVWHLAKIAQETGSSIFLLGSRGDTSTRAAEALKEELPNLKVVGTSSANPDDLTIAQKIKDANSDIVLVAYGAPQQEYWIAKHKAETGAKILIGVGGTFDILSGKLPRAPYFMRMLQLEWLWRLILEPSRFVRIWNALLVFPLKALSEKDAA